MPIYTDKRTGKKVIQYQIGYKYVSDPERPGKLLKRPKYKTEVVGKSVRVDGKVLVKREAPGRKRNTPKSLPKKDPETSTPLGSSWPGTLNSLR